MARRPCWLLMMVLAATAGCGERGDADPGVTAALALAENAAPSQGRGVPLSYNRDVRPILADKCFACHGPDRAAMEAELRLDTFDDGAGYFGASLVIEPGNPDQSELIRRIESQRVREVMPPPHFKVTLTQNEKALLRAWVEQGAGYEPHWAFVPLPEQVALPEVSDAGWVRDGLDRFVLSRLERAGLSPSPEASRPRWLRRVTFDLTGLPPTEQAIRAFLADDKPGAYERVVDRLLASPHFGERMAVPWLDLARYADTYGYTVDGLRASWPWRDWVVRAFNDNLSYDRFLTWQVAGDLIGQASREQQLATAFNRLHRINAEGGAIREEWRNEGVADRLHTFGTAFMGLTLECARCHDLRYDPIGQDEYYELFAFFNSIDESGTTEYRRPDIVPPPSLLLLSAAQQAELDRLGQAVAEAERALDARTRDRDAAFLAWRGTDAGPRTIPDLVGDFSLDAIRDHRLDNRVPGGEAGRVGQHESTHPPRSETGALGQALRFDGDNFAALPGLDDIDRWTPFTVSLWFKVDALDTGTPRVIAKRTSGTDVGPYGFDLVLDHGRIAARAYRHWPGNAIGVRTGDLVRPGQWVHVVWRYDGSSRAAGLSLRINGEAVDLETVRDGPMLKTVGGGQPYGPGKHQLILGQRFRDRGLSGGVIDEVKLIRRAVADIEARHLFDGQALDTADDAALRGYYLAAIDPGLREARAQLAERRQQQVMFETKVPEIAVMRELSEPRPAHVLGRGLYDAERNASNRVSRDVPEHVMPWIEGAPRDRLGLAQWLTHPRHPLTARVAVNRLWQQCFGHGLVGSADNFGLQGALPTHPGLLDYLARSYVDSGWDTKALLRRIVLSAVYRQDSSATESLRQSDPANELLARGPARRLDAEMVRDTALAASGLLVPSVGGPPAYPYQPEGLWQQVSGNRYRVGGGDALYRRSLYTVWKRAVPMPNMMAFDAPTREACVARRSPTNTPLQALVLLNDVQFVEAARVLAQRVMHERPDDAGRIDHGFRLLTGRLPTTTEADRLMQLLDHQRGVFRDDPDGATALLAVGAAQRDDALDAPEHAAWAVVMHAVLNLDATVWLR